MAFAFIQDMPITTDDYDRLMDEMGRDTPAGLIAHVVAKTDDGLRYVDVWETEGDWKAFHEQRIEPALGRIYAGTERPDLSAMRVEMLDVHDVIAPHQIGA